jgi:hypothetical protein
MMYDCADILPGRKKMLKMVAPRGWIIPAAIAFHLGPPQHDLDAASHPRCRFVLRLPDWLKHLLHEASADRTHGQLADDRAGVIGQGLFPLVGVLGVLPARTLRRDEKLGCLVEGDRACRRDRRGFLSLASFLDGMKTFKDFSGVLSAF